MNIYIWVYKYIQVNRFRSSSIESSTGGSYLWQSCYAADISLDKVKFSTKTQNDNSIFNAIRCTRAISIILCWGLSLNINKK